MLHGVFSPIGSSQDDHPAEARHSEDGRASKKVCLVARSKTQAATCKAPKAPGTLKPQALAHTPDRVSRPWQLSPGTCPLASQTPAELLLCAGTSNTQMRDGQGSAAQQGHESPTSLEPTTRPHKTSGPYIWGGKIPYFIDTQNQKTSNSPSPCKPHVEPVYTVLGAQAIPSLLAEAYLRASLVFTGRPVLGCRGLRTCARAALQTICFVRYSFFQYPASLSPADSKL